MLCLVLKSVKKFIIGNFWTKTLAHYGFIFSFSDYLVFLFLFIWKFISLSRSIYIIACVLINGWFSKFWNCSFLLETLDMFGNFTSIIILLIVLFSCWIYWWFDRPVHVVCSYESYNIFIVHSKRYHYCLGVWLSMVCFLSCWFFAIILVPSRLFV